MGEAKPRRRWFRFSLRTLFVVLTLCGVWLGVQVKWVRDRRAARLWIAEHQPKAGPGPRYSWYVFNPLPVSTKPFPWVLKALGEQPVPSISIAVGTNDSEQAERLEKLFPEANIQIVRSE